MKPSQSLSKPSKTLLKPVKPSKTLKQGRSAARIKRDEQKRKGDEKISTPNKCMYIWVTYALACDVPAHSIRNRDVISALAPLQLKPVAVLLRIHELIEYIHPVCIKVWMGTSGAGCYGDRLTIQRLMLATPSPRACAQHRWNSGEDGHDHGNRLDINQKQVANAAKTFQGQADADGFWTRLASAMAACGF